MNPIALFSAPICRTFFVGEGAEKLKLIAAAAPALDTPSVTDISIHIVRGSVIQGELSFTLIEARKAEKEGALWDLLGETSLLAQMDELVNIVEPVVPAQLLILEHFARTSYCCLPPRALTRAVAHFLADTQVQFELGVISAVMVTYPFPPDVYDEEAGARITRLYEQEWGLESATEKGRLRVLRISEQVRKQRLERDLVNPEPQNFGLDYSVAAKLPSWGYLTGKERKELQTRFPDYLG